jgi:hypothetical protein
VNGVSDYWPELKAGGGDRDFGEMRLDKEAQGRRWQADGRWVFKN